MKKIMNYNMFKEMYRVYRDGGIDDFSFYKFEDYVFVSDRNSLAYATAIAIAEDPGKSNSPLFLYSKEKLGKTYLIKCISKYILDNHLDYKVLYVKCNDFIKDINKYCNDELFKKYIKYKVIIIDDLHIIINNKIAQKKLYNILNFACHNKIQMIFASKLSLTKLQDNKINTNLINTMKKGITCQLSKPDRVETIAILRKIIKEKEYIDNKIKCINKYRKHHDIRKNEYN